MANNIITLEILARELALVLKHKVHFPGLVHTDYTKEFVAGSGGQVNVIKPTTFVANNFTGNIVKQDIQESEILVKMDKIADVSLNLTSKDLTLDIDQISERVLKPAAEALAKSIDIAIATHLTLITTPEDTIVEGEYGRKDVINARKLLNKNDAPDADRYFVASADVEAELLSDELFVSAEKKGDTVALKEASIGRVFGFDIYNSNALADGALAFHKNAVAFVNRPMVAPSSAESYVWVEDGISFRITKAYDINTKSETFSVDCLYGIATLDTDLAVRIVDQPE